MKEKKGVSVFGSKVSQRPIRVYVPPLCWERLKTAIIGI